MPGKLPLIAFREPSSHRGSHSKRSRGAGGVTRLTPPTPPPLWGLHDGPRDLQRENKSRGDEGCFSPALTWGLHGAPPGAWKRLCGHQAWQGRSWREEGPRHRGLGWPRANRKRLYKRCAKISPSEQVTLDAGVSLLHPRTPKKISEALKKCSWLLFGRMGVGKG